MLRLEILTTLTIVKNRIRAVIIRIIDVLGKYIDEIIIECEAEGVEVKLEMWIFEMIKSVDIIVRE